MYLAASTLCFIAQNNDRKLGMPTTQASHKNEIWNVMYNIQINYNKTSESDEIFFSQVAGKTKNNFTEKNACLNNTNPAQKTWVSNPTTGLSSVRYIR